MDKIDATAESLLDEAIGYAFTDKINFTSAGTDLIIEPADLTALRCDGVTEYVYSYSGANIQSPNMKYVSGAQIHNDNCTSIYTPKTQAGAMIRVS